MINVAVAQIDTVLGDKQKNLLKIEDFCRRAAAAQADILCFPEMATTGYSPDLLGTDLWALSDAAGGETDVLLSQLADTLKLTIICGIVERGEIRGDVYNAAGIWRPGKSGMVTSRKIHLINQERSWFTAGDQIRVFDTPCCRIGVLICHDIGFPELSRLLTLQGADILFLPVAWIVEKRENWRIHCPTRALENGIHLVGANRWGQEDNLTFFGGSQLIGPDGQILATASESGEDLFLCEVDLALQAKARLNIPYLRDRRTDLYSVNYVAER